MYLVRIVGVAMVANMSDQGPFKDAFNSDIDGVIRREINTYRIKDGIMIKESATRDYYKSGNYHDSQTIIPIVEK